MIPIQKAKSIIQKHIPLLEVETVSLNNTGNRVLALRIENGTVVVVWHFSLRPDQDLREAVELCASDRTVRG